MADRHTVSESGPFVNEFMNMMKSRGPSMEPWGTPEVTWQGADVNPSMTVHCCLFEW